MKAIVDNFLADLNEEVFALHPDFNLYSFSNYGRIKYIPTGHIRKSTRNKYGYEIISLKQDDGHRRTTGVHRLIAETFYTNLLHKKSEVNHIDANKQNNNLSNLDWVSHQENIDHVVEMGLYKKRFREANHASKVSRDNITEMKKLREMGLTYKEISVKYNLSEKHTSKLIRKDI